jgi:hypothetical protein
MTKVQTVFELTRPLDDAAMEAISRATGIYGIHYVRLAPTLDRVTVEYDASRLLPEHVPASLVRAGVPVRAHG